MPSLIRLVLAVALLLSAALAAAQPKPPHRIGVLLVGAAGAPINRNLDVFYEALRGLGYVEGRNLVIERRYGDGREDRLEAMAAELVRSNVEVIVAPGPSATRAARQATSTIPIVMGTHDAVEQGLVSSLGRPGGNLTGWTVLSSESGGRQLQKLKEAIPKLQRVAVISNPAMPGRSNLMQSLNKDARALGLRLHQVDVPNAEAMTAAFAAMREARDEAFFVISENTVIDPMRDRIIALASEHRLPAMYGWRVYPDEGGLMAFGPNLAQLIRRYAYFVDRILNGAKPADLPVETPREYALVLNLDTASALGITFPRSLRVSAEYAVRAPGSANQK